MENKFENTKTQGNLLTAFTGESMARNKYTFFAAAARKEGYEEIARIFEETADNERAHAKVWFSLLEQLGDTAFNLRSASEGEHYEWSEMYKTFARDAREEQRPDIAFLFEKAAQVEKAHQERFDALLDRLEKGETFRQKGGARWKCQNCGMVVEGEVAPDKCPLCSHPKSFFRREPDCL